MSTVPTPDAIRDPLYGPIVLDETARALIDTPVFQRLRRIRQLSEAYAVYPSAMHTRFEHSVGVHHLARTVVAQLAERGELGPAEAEDAQLVPLAALLHDLGHHLGAHLLEEFGWPGVSHEDAATSLYTSGEVGAILAATGIPDAGSKVGELVRHVGVHPLGGIVSGACDADKLDYLVRDAYHCGLPAGFDQAHLRSALTLVDDPATGRRTLGLVAEGLGSFEQMLVTKNALYRQVYFHPVVRGAMVMLRAILVAALEGGLLAMDELLAWTDEEVLTLLRLRVRASPSADAPATYVATMIERLLARRLVKRVAALPLAAAADLAPRQIAEAERRLEATIGAAPGSLLIDVPRKPTMLSTDILVRRDDGVVVPAATLGPEDGFAINAAQGALYAASGKVGVYAAAPVAVAPAQVLQAFEAVSR